MNDGLEALLNVTEEQKEARGIQHTPREIAQQPASWRSTHQILLEQQHGVRQFLIESGLDQGRPSASTTVFLVGAGTSDYVGRALAPLLRRMWGCEVWAVPSTDLLTNLEDLVFLEPRPSADRAFSASLQRRSRAACSDGSVIGSSTNSLRVGLYEDFRAFFFMG